MNPADLVLTAADGAAFWLPVAWLGVIGFGVLMYVLLDGFVLGLGILAPLAEDSDQLDHMMNTAAPIWDGNETWLVLGGAGLMAAFPRAYALVLSSLYLPVLAMLLGLIFRGVAFEFRFKGRGVARQAWGAAFSIGSIVAAFSQGVILAALVQGLPMEGGHYSGGTWGWLSPFALMTGVALLQPNIEQSLKWRPEMLQRWLEVNLSMLRDNPAQLVVLPETTIPLLIDHLPPDYREALARTAAGHGGDVIFGTFVRDDAGRIFNAAVSLGSAPPAFYAKQHLVPFGEYSPPLFSWFYALASIPMADQTRGAARQPPMALAGQKVAVNICYEDVFGEELIRSLPEATLLLNLSNLAWYGDSFAQPQHLQIARLRALETGRPMLRSTNTGMTALVAPDGRVEAVLPAFAAGALHVAVRGYQGLTPYARWGNWAAVLAALAVLGLAARRPRG